MTAVNLLIVYYSATGTNYQMAHWAAQGARQADAEVRIVKAAELASEAAIASNPAWKAHVEASKHIPNATPEDLEWADAIIFSTPTRYGNVSAQMKQFLDSTGGLWAQGKLANKVVSAMSSAGNPHGGQEETILSLYTTMYHWGAVIAAPGYTAPATFEAGGNPYGTSVSVDRQGNMKEEVEGAVIHQAKRTVTIARWLKKGQQ